MNDFFDTIIAISTPPGYGGISVIKVSGSSALEVAAKFFRQKTGPLLKPKPFRFYYGHIIDPASNNIMDECLLLFMKAPKSFTGEDTIEIQCHGGPVTAQRILFLILGESVRLARPGEFSKRAFLNGKRDLPRTEAIEEIVHARSIIHQDNAVKQLTGRIENLFAPIYEKIKQTELSLEAEISFPEDVESPGQSLAEDFTDQIVTVLDGLIESYNDSQFFKKGVDAAIVGRVNVGKSSLLNRLLDYDRAIVSSVPGTTRDFIQEEIVLDGVPLNIIDTAGLRETDDSVEKAGIEKTKERIAKAKIIFAVFDLSSSADIQDQEILRLLQNKNDAEIFIVMNKLDKGKVFDLKIIPQKFNIVEISILTGEGVDGFKKLFSEKIHNVYKRSERRDFYVTNPRHYEIIKEMRSALTTYKTGPSNRDALLFALGEFGRLYNRLLGKAADVKEIDEIFNKFCIGK